MKITITLTESNIKEAIKMWLDQSAGFHVEKTEDIVFNASQKTDYLDQPCGGFLVSADVKAKKK